MFKDAQILVTCPEEVLDSLREGEINNGLKEVVHEDLPLDAVGATADPELCDDIVNIDLTLLAAVLQLFLKAIVKLLSSIEKLLNRVNM